MKERPILFSAPMVRAIMSGTKTQTRRVVKPQPTGFLGGPGVKMPNGTPAPLIPMDETVPPFGREILCPYGQPGDRVWVREAWARDDEDGALMYRADLGQGGDADDWERNRIEGVPRFRWKPSIHMPRSASRITLEVTGVRVERLQDISEADALAEGITLHPDHHRKPRDSLYGPVRTYADLWEAINGPDSWAANPWVWVVEFKRIDGAKT